MGIIEFVGILCEVVDRHSGNFQPVLFHSHACQTSAEQAERAGGILCTVHLTPAGELSEGPTGCACPFVCGPGLQAQRLLKGGDLLLQSLKRFMIFYNHATLI